MKFYWNGNEIIGCPGKGIFWNGIRATRVFWNGVQVLEDSSSATPPDDFTASDTECEQITFTWTSPGDGENTTTRFDLYQGANLVASDVNSGHTETIRQKTPLPYHLGVYDICGENVSNIDDGSSYWKADAPTGFTASDGACDNITFTWTNPVETGNPDATYDIYQGNTLVASGETSPAVVAYNQAYAVDFHVKAVNACGSEESNTDSGYSTWKPTAPSSASASECGTSSVTVSWNVSSDVGSPGCTYNIYRNSSLIASSVTSPYIDASAPTDATHTYYVRATNECGYSDSETDTGYIGRQPSAPRSPSATDCTSSAITVTWSAPSDTGYPACTYDVYRDGVMIATGVSSPYVDSTASTNTTYSYYIRATNACGYTNSSNTNGARGGKPSAPTNFVASNNDAGIEGYVRCTWTNPSNKGYPTCTYNIYRDNVLVATNVTSGYLHNNGSWGGNNTYYVRATNSCGYSNSNTDVGSAYQLDPPKTTTFTSSGTHYIGNGHTKADYCIVGGGGSGGYRPNAGNHAGGGYKGYTASGSNISNTGNVSVTIGGGGAGVNAGASTSGGKKGGTTSCPWNVAGGGNGGSANSAVYAGNGAIGTSVCSNSARSDGIKNGGTDQSWGGQASVGNGGNGGLGGGGGTGGSGAGGGAEIHGATSGAGGAGWAKITTY